MNFHITSGARSLASVAGTTQKYPPLTIVNRAITKSYNALLIFGILICSGCATTELVELESEIKPILDKHGSITETMKRLKGLGFNCIEGTSLALKKKDIYECERSQGNIWPPFSCIHRVWLTNTSPNSDVLKYEILKPMCTGV